MVKLLSSFLTRFQLPKASITSRFDQNRSSTQRPRSNARLFDDLAVEQFLSLLDWLPDPDQILSQAGLERAALSKLEYDDEISSALDIRLSALKSTPWRLVPDNNDIAEFVNEQLIPRIDSLLGDIWRARLYGYSVIEVVYRKESDRILWQSIGRKPINWFKPQRDGSLKYRAANGTWQEGDTAFKFFLTRCDPTYQNPYGEALLSRLYWPWFYRHHGWQFWGRYLERMAGGMIVGRTNGDTGVMAAALNQLTQSGVIALSSSDEVDAKMPTGNGEAYEKFEGALNRRVQKLVIGRVLTADLQRVGSNAAQKTEDSVRSDKRLADQKLVEPTLQCIIDALVKLNFADAESPQFVIADEKGLEPDRAERDAKLLGSGQVRFSEQYYLREYDYVEGDVELVQPSTNTSFSASAQGPLSFAATSSPKLTPGQRAVEKLISSSLDDGERVVFISEQALRETIQTATDPDDLTERLVALAGNTSRGDFEALLERALFAADIMGYAHAHAQNQD